MNIRHQFYGFTIISYCLSQSYSLQCGRLLCLPGSIHITGEYCMFYEVIVFYLFLHFFYCYKVILWNRKGLTISFESKSLTAGTKNVVKYHQFTPDSSPNVYLPPTPPPTLHTHPRIFCRLHIRLPEITSPSHRPLPN